jgi:flagellar hook-length control protein FliK
MPELASNPVLPVPSAASSAAGRPSSSSADAESDFAAAFAEADAAWSGQPQPVPPGATAKKAATAAASPAKDGSEAQSDSESESAVPNGWLPFVPAETLARMQCGISEAEVVDETPQGWQAQAARPPASAIALEAGTAQDSSVPAEPSHLRAGLAPRSRADAATGATASALPLPSGTSGEEVVPGTGMPATSFLGGKPGAASFASAPVTEGPAAAKPVLAGSTARGGNGALGLGNGREESVASSAAPSGLRAAAADRLVEDFRHRIEHATTANAPAATRPDMGPYPPALATSAWAAFGTPTSFTQPLPQLVVATPVGSPGFSEDFSQQVAMMTRGGVHRAELSLEPADLGPVGVSIEMRGNDATVLFIAQHAATRATLEEALPRLREMLTAQGLQLADARVGTNAGGGSSRDSDRRQQGFVAAVDRPQGQPDLALPASPVAVRPRQARLIDDIA